MPLRREPFSRLPRAGCGSPGPRSGTICGKTVWWAAATPRRLAARLRCRKRTSSSLTDATKWTDTFVKCRWASQLLEHLAAVIVRSLPTTSIFSYLLHRCSRNFCVDVLPTTSMFSYSLYRYYLTYYIDVLLPMYDMTCVLYDMYTV